MARAEVLWPFIKSWEGGYAVVKNDKGGATNMGVTIGTWKKLGYDKDGDGDIDEEDLKLLTDEDAIRLMKQSFWDKWKADEILDQSVANLLVDWLWNSGSYGIRISQRILGVKVDGIVGPKTLAALNAREPRKLFALLKQEREAYFRRICISTPSNKVFLKGWLNRLDGIRYGALVLNDRKKTVVKF